MTTIVPFSLKNAPALTERLLPVQKLSAEAYKEQMAGSGKTLTALGSYWKGRKPLILNKACVLGCLVPATGNDVRDLEIFEKLMAFDDESFVVRAKQRPTPKDIATTLSIPDISRYFTVTPAGALQPKFDAKGYFAHTALGPDLMTNAKNAVRGIIDWLVRENMKLWDGTVEEFHRSAQRDSRDKEVIGRVGRG